MTVDNFSRSVAHLELLGIGSHRHQLFKTNLVRAMEDLRISNPISEVTDLADLLNYDIAGIPALVINGRVIFQKVVPSVEDLKLVLGTILARPRIGFQLNRVVVPTDFSPAADNALRYSMALASSYQADVRLVHVHQHVAPSGSFGQLSLGNSDFLEVKRALLQDRIRRFGKEAKTIKLEEELQCGKVVETLREIAQREHTDLLVLGATGEGANRLERIGSHASAVARRADCPVLLVPQDVAFRPYKRIVFASKLLPGEESVWPKVVDLAIHYGAEIHFVHVQEKEVNGYHLGKAQKGQSLLDGQAPFRIVTIQAKNVIEGLSQYAEEQQADLLVMATTHRNFLQDLLHRSATHRMIFTSKIPLLVLHFSLPNSA